MYANNELGTIQPLREIAKIIHEVRSERLESGNKLPVYFHTDAAQAGNFLNLHVSRLGVDLMSVNGGKIYGPKQTGLLYVKAGIELKPLVLGGGQERGLRSGTENVPGFIGFAKALDIAQKMKDKESKRLKEVRDLFVTELENNIPDFKINGSRKHQTPHIIHVTFQGVDNERLMMELDERGVQCAVGSACSASSAEPSHVLTAIGMDDKEARASLRFSFGRQTTKKDIIKTVKILKTLLDQ
jgi:cysteine desulfurase